jgi:hypothetical protein
MNRLRLAQGILLVRFATQYQLAATFLRLQEHYESSRFSDRVFTLEEFMDWYAEAFGRFSYFEDWSGFNVPSKALDPFYAGLFDPLLDKERRFLDLFRDEPRPFYVLGVTEESSRGDLRHEIAHALFTMRPAYRVAVVRALRSYDTSPIDRQLHRLGYARHVLRDEAHAALVAGNGSLHVPRSFDRLKEELRAIFQEHGEQLMKKARKPRTKRRAARTR